MDREEEILLLLRDEVRSIEAKLTRLPTASHLRAAFFCIMIASMGMLFVTL